MTAGPSVHEGAARASRTPASARDRGAGATRRNAARASRAPSSALRSGDAEAGVTAA